MENIEKMNITIGIAAYNAEKNIKNLLSSVLMQKGNDFNITKIIVHSDNSHDRTIEESKNVMDQRIQIIDNNSRKGFAGSVQTILEQFDGDVIILLNDDIKILDNFFIQKLIEPFRSLENVGLVSGNPRPLPGRNFIEKAISHRFDANDKLRNRILKGNNKHTCDGKVLALSKSFAGRIQFPEEKRDMGNLDAYFYFLCITNGFVFIHSRDAIVFYRNPSTLKDYVSWYARNDANKRILKKKFGNIVDIEFHKPVHLVIFYGFLGFTRHPISFIFIIFTELYIKYKSNNLASSFSEKWEVVQSTKDI